MPIAVQSGYGDEQKLRRAFQRQLGANPAMYRSHFSGHAEVAKSKPVSLSFAEGRD